MNDADLVGLCAAIYVPQPEGFWDQYWDGSAADGICAGIKDNAIIFRGSVTIGDWFRDFMAVPNRLLNHPQLGPVHAGFYEGMDEFFEKASKLLGPNPAVGGHSLGAARAWLFAGRYVAEGGSPSRIAVFGSPKPGCQPLGQLLTQIPKSSYRNGFDPVTEVPLWIGRDIATEPTSLQNLNIGPSDWSEGPMAWHNIHLYAQGVSALGV